MKFIASISFGKDSLAMLLKLLELNYPLDEVVYFDIGVEFDSIRNNAERMKPILSEKGIEFTILYPKESFIYNMTERPVRKRKGECQKGWLWCGGNARWGTGMKLEAIAENNAKYGEEMIVEYVGVASDERLRINRDRQGNRVKIYPLVECGMTEKDCLDYCYQQGYDWQEYEPILDKYIRLYDILPRVSCWCCRNKNLDELRNYYHYLPSYWNRLKEMQCKLPCDPMKKASGSVFDLEKRYMLEDKWIADGREKEIRSKKFFEELKMKLKEENRKE